MLSCAQTCQVRNCSYRTVNDTQGGRKLCMVSLYLGLLTHINCRVTKRIINPLKVHKNELLSWDKTSKKDTFWYFCTPAVWKCITHSRFTSLSKDNDVAWLNLWFHKFPLSVSGRKHIFELPRLHKVGQCSLLWSEFRSSFYVSLQGWCLLSGISLLRIATTLRYLLPNKYEQITQVSHRHTDTNHRITANHIHFDTKKRNAFEFCRLTADYHFSHVSKLVNQGFAQACLIHFK